MTLQRSVLPILIVKLVQVLLSDVSQVQSIQVLEVAHLLHVITDLLATIVLKLVTESPLTAHWDSIVNQESQHQLLVV